jgi:sugar-specific transcriptional regulator TrmB
MKELETFLITIGISEKEAKIYIHLLSFDSANISEISKKTGINRTTIYPLIDSLLEKGLVEEVLENDKNKIRALSPEKIETFIENQKLMLYEKSKIVKSMIPKFKAVYRGDGQRPIVEYYDGKEEILQSAKDAVSNKILNESVYIIYPRDEIEKNFSEQDLKNVKEERIKRGIDINSIYTYVGDKEYSSSLTKNRIKLDQKKYPIKSEIGVYGDSVRIHIFGKTPGTIFIKSNDVAQTVKTMFKLIFDKHKQ